MSQKKEKITHKMMTQKRSVEEDEKRKHLEENE